MGIFKDKKTAKGCHIYQMLRRSARKKHLSFHTPGHKIGKWDVTELSYSDNLASPHGCIAHAEEDLAAIVGAKRSFLLTDGSTSGVLSMLYAAKKAGARKILLSEKSHQSAFHGCALLDLTPLVYEEKTENGIPLPTTLTTLREEYPDLLEGADVLFFTSPTYYGDVVNLKEMSSYCKKTGKLLFVDGAHGGHLRFDKKLYAGTYADAWVDGVHKSLPAFTQGALLSGNSRVSELLGQAVKHFRTTSPSYPVMASVEYAVKLPRNEWLEKEVCAYADGEDRVRLSHDWTKLCALFGENAFPAHQELEKRGIYPEFCDGNAIMFYLSPALKRRAFRTLKKELTLLFEKYPYVEKKVIQRDHAPLVFPENKETKWVTLSKSVGKICAQSCGLFPPCTPLISRGERIEEEYIHLLEHANNVYGLTDGKILIFK